MRGKCAVGERAMENKARSQRREIATVKSVRILVCMVLCILSVLPFWIMLVNATRNSAAIEEHVSLIPSSFFLDNVKKLFSKTDRNITFFTYLENSSIVSLASVSVCVYFSALTAYGLFAYRFKGNRMIWSLILGMMLIPQQVSAIGFYRFMYKIGLVNNYLALILPMIASPGTVFFMKQYMEGTFPLQIVEAARIDGSSEFHTFNIIGIPLLKPAVVIQCIFSFISSWNSYYMPSMLLSRQKLYTLPMFMQLLKSNVYHTDFGIVYAGLLLSIAPVMTVYFILSKQIVAGVAIGGIKE